MRLRVAVGQFAPEKAEVERNLDTIAEAMRQAVAEAADLLVLPEAATTGYFLEGGVLEAALSSDQLASKLSSRVGRLERELWTVVGFYENSDGRLTNSAALLRAEGAGVEVRGVYRKFFLPTYGVFDEERFVSRGRELGVFETPWGKLGILICEDVWHSILPTLNAAAGAQILAVPAASPARGFTGEHIANHDRYRRLFRAISEEHGLFCVNAQLCGFEGGKGFVGGSVVVDPFGNTLAEAPVADPAMVVADLDLATVAIARAQSPLLADLQSAWGDVRRLVHEID